MLCLSSALIFGRNTILPSVLIKSFFTVQFLTQKYIALQTSAKNVFNHANGYVKYCFYVFSIFSSSLWFLTQLLRNFNAIHHIFLLKVYASPSLSVASGMGLTLIRHRDGLHVARLMARRTTALSDRTPDKASTPPNCGEKKPSPSAPTGAANLEPSRWRLKVSPRREPGRCPPPRLQLTESRPWAGRMSTKDSWRQSSFHDSFHSMHWFSAGRMGYMFL